VEFFLKFPEKNLTSAEIFRQFVIYIFEHCLRFKGIFSVTLSGECNFQQTCSNMLYRPIGKFPETFLHSIFPEKLQPYLCLYICTCEGSYECVDE